MCNQCNTKNSPNFDNNECADTHKAGLAVPAPSRGLPALLDPHVHDLAVLGEELHQVLTTATVRQVAHKQLLAVPETLQH